MKISVFPYKNHYFSIGLEAFQGLTPSFVAELHTVVVVDLTQWSIKEIVSSKWVENSESGKMIIIYDTKLLPLANYYNLKNNNIIAICRESESLKVLDDFFRGRLARQTDSYYQEPHLTEKEFISLRYVLQGISAKEQAQNMGVCTKTAYAFRYNLAKKMQVKKLSHLLFPFSCQHQTKLYQADCLALDSTISPCFCVLLNQ